MAKFMSRAGCAMAVIALAGCASSPKEISAAYVSPIKYQNYDCQQIGLEQANVEQRTNTLYHSIKGRNNSDKWVMGAGLVLFWPALFFLKGDNGAENSEFAQLKGEYEALRETSIMKKCQLVFADDLAKTVKEEDGKKGASGDIAAER